MAGGLVWTIGQNGRLYGLDPVTGKVRQQATIGAPANHCPTPGIGASLLLAPSAQNVIAFRTSSAGASRADGAMASATRDNHHCSPPEPAARWRVIAGVVLACLVAIGALGWFVWLCHRRT